MIATLAQAAPVSIEVGPGLGAVLIAAIAGLAGGVGYGVRWLMRQFEVQQEKFSLAIASQAASCAEEQAALIVAFERRCDRDDAERAKDRDARHAIAERTAVVIADVQASILRAARMEAAGAGPSASGAHPAAAPGL